MGGGKIAFKYLGDKMFYKKCDICDAKLNKAKSVFLKQGMVCKCGVSYIAKNQNVFYFLCLCGLFFQRF